MYVNCNLPGGMWSMSPAFAVIGPKTSDKIPRNLYRNVFISYPEIWDDIIVKHCSFKRDGRSGKIFSRIGKENISCENPKYKGIYNGPQKSAYKELKESGLHYRSLWIIYQCRLVKEIFWKAWFYCKYSYNSSLKCL